MANFVEDIRKSVVDIYGIKDQLGATKEPTFLFLRHWPEGKGVGQPSLQRKRILPSPTIINLSVARGSTAHGTEKRANIRLRGIPRGKYLYDSEINGQAPDDNSEIFYQVGTYFYNVQAMEKTLVSYAVDLSKIQTRFFGDPIEVDDWMFTGQYKLTGSREYRPSETLEVVD